MADQPITTSIDSLVKYLKEHGETDTTTLSRLLNVNEGTIVDWSDILEKAGMVKIAYKVGKMFLSPMGGAAAAQPQVEKAVVDIKKGTIENEILSQDEMLNNIRAKIEAYSRTVKNAESVFMEQSGKAKKALDKINIMEREANKYYNSINTKHDGVVKTIDMLDKEMASLETEADQIRQFNLDTSGARGVLEDISNKISVFNSNLKQMDSEFNRMVTEQKNQLKAIEASVKVEINVLKDAADAESKRIAEYDAALKEYKKKSEAQAIEMRKARTQILDEAIKTRDEVLGIYSAASAQFNSLNGSLNGMKDSWGLLAVFNDKLETIKHDIEECTKELDVLQKQLNEASTDLKNPKARKSRSITDLDADVRNMRTKTNELNKKGEKITKDLQDLSKKQ